MQDLEGGRSKVIYPKLNQVTYGVPPVNIEPRPNLGQDKGDGRSPRVSKAEHSAKPGSRSKPDGINPQVVAVEGLKS